MKKTRKAPRQRIQREDGTWWTRRGAQLTRNANTLTESEFWGKIRSALRAASRYWKPALLAVEKHTRPYKGKDKRIKSEVQCQMCFSWVPKSQIHKDHIKTCGTLTCEDDVVLFIRNLFLEDVEGFQPLCKQCHKDKTNQERRND